MGEQQAVGHRCLLQRLGVCADLRQSVRGRNGRHHPIATKALGDKRVFVDAENNRGRIGQTGGFDDHAGERRNFAPQAAHEQIFQRPQQIAAHRAANAAGAEQNQCVVDLLDQQVVDADFTELVDQHCRASHLRLP